MDWQIMWTLIDQINAEFTSEREYDDFVFDEDLQIFRVSVIANSAEEDVDNEADHSIKDNQFVMIAGSSKAPSLKTLPFDDKLAFQKT
ncbi:hypothetical protein KIN20_028303 [Parelaphostrongylus tenuis]|uniref:Uncharacterized protein n=1 Tax=Parelaphostrongylus tenuis TaxID=148309 RepID=A0AAD5WEP3_PARTN|nr:hypothetical protein KIN20_028303 [Parelaphostrongylus tenuis]